MSEPFEVTPDYDKYRGTTAEEAEHAREADRIRAVDDDPRTVAARRASELRKMSFEQYRTTPERRSRRDRVVLRAGNRSELCGKRERLDVHHRSYERYGAEQFGDLIALCRSCHQPFHDILPDAA